MFGFQFQASRNLSKRNGTYSHPIPVHKSLKLLKRPIKRWSKKIYGKLDEKQNRLEKELSKVEKRLEEDHVSLVAREKVISVHLKHIQVKRNQLWKQKSRCKMLSDKDNNTKYFHTVETLTKKRNMITSLTIDGRIVAEPQLLHRRIIEHF